MTEAPAPIIAPPPAPEPPAVLAEACRVWERLTGTQLCARAYVNAGTWRFSVYREGKMAGWLFFYTAASPRTVKFARTGPGATGGLRLSAQEREALAAVRALLAAGGGAGEVL